MDMDHLIGQRFNLISKSEIRYVGTLHQINPEQSTIALEDVYSYGTEGRQSDNFIPASNQKFDYIVFRGSDVKDIKVVEERKENHQPEQNMPNDPAILNASRPTQPSPGMPVQNTFQPGFAPPPNFPNPNFYPPFNPNFRPPGPPGPPGPNYPGMMYQPPPPGYFGQGPAFPPNTSAFPPMPPGNVGPPQFPDQEPNELPVNDRGHAGNTRGPSRVSTVSPHPGPTPPNDSKPSVSEALAPVVTAPTSALLAPLSQSTKSVVNQNRIAPALPFLVNNRSNAPLVSIANKPATPTKVMSAESAPSQIAIEEANRRAKAAVANAMAKMNGGQGSNPVPTVHPKPVAGGNPVQILTQKVAEMKVAEPRTEFREHRGRGGSRGRGHRGAHQVRNVEIPKSDYDFESANAKFNKEDMIKEAIASGSPIGEAGDESSSLNAASAANGEKRKESLGTTEVYNKSSSFFDNLSSELKDREEGNNPNNRMARGQELKKNVETFGQGSVDAGFRGRGRGYRGRGRGYGYGGYGQRGYGGYARGGGGAGGGRGRGREEQSQPTTS